MSKNYISMKQIWADYDTTIEVEVCVSVAQTFCNGSVRFVNTVYTNVKQVDLILEKLSNFYDQTESELEVELGGLGTTYANGFTRIKLKKTPTGLIYIDVFQQSDFGPSANSKITHEAQTHLVCEPNSLDRFVKEYEKSRARNYCAEVLPIGVTEDYDLDDSHNLTEEVILECQDHFDVASLQPYL